MTSIDCDGLCAHRFPVSGTYAIGSVEVEGPLISNEELCRLARRAGILALDLPSAARSVNTVVGEWLSQSLTLANASGAITFESVISALDVLPTGLDASSSSVVLSKLKALAVAADEPIHLRPLTTIQVADAIIVCITYFSFSHQVQPPSPSNAHTHTTKLRKV